MMSARTKLLAVLAVIAAMAIGLGSMAAVLPAEDAPTCKGKRATITAPDKWTEKGTPIYEGTNDDDVILAKAGNKDIIFGKGGDDTICGNGGHGDGIEGGAGIDNINGSDGIDFISGGPGDDKINGFDDKDALYGGDGRDEIFGDGGRDYIRGGGGTDHLHGNTGDDAIWAGEGDDERIHGGDGRDICVGVGNDANRWDCEQLDWNSVCPPEFAWFMGVYHANYMEENAPAFRLALRDHHCSVIEGEIVHVDGVTSDGDVHMTLNIGSSGGWCAGTGPGSNLIVEYMPRDRGHLPRVSKGDRVRLTGACVVDVGHPDKHSEMHPVFKTEIKGTTTQGSSGPEYGGNPVGSGGVPKCFDQDGDPCRSWSDTYHQYSVTSSALFESDN